MTLGVREHSVTLHVTVVDQITAHGREQKEKGNWEAVGFVASPGGRAVATAYLPLNNHSSSPTNSFFVEPWEQYRAEMKLKGQGYSIVGVAHSHPNSEALPSHSDHSMARPGEFVFIYSVVFADLKAYKAVDEVLEPAILVVEGE